MQLAKQATCNYTHTNGVTSVCKHSMAEHTSCGAIVSRDDSVLTAGYEQSAKDQ